MMEVLAAERVSKRFRSVRTRPVTLKAALLRRIARNGAERQDAAYHWALRDVSFSVQRGDAVGIIGHNGAGKSTLLRLLCGVGRPTSGTIRRRGQVQGLLELGSGFQPDLSGRENLITGGVLSGLSEAEVRAREDEIIAFAELEEFIDQPVRTYSTGMYMRLAFATAMHFDPTVLVVDEVLAVGDARFQAKCLERLRAFRTGGGTLVLTSHVPDHIGSLCDEVLVLEEGRVATMADPETALQCYDDLMRKRTERRAAQIDRRTVEIAERGNRHGTQEVRVTAVRLLDPGGAPLGTLRSGGDLVIEMDYERVEGVSDAAFALGIFADAVKCFEVSLESMAVTFQPFGRTGTLRCRLPRVALLPGEYWINVGLFASDWDYTYDYHWQVHPLVVQGAGTATGGLSGVMALEPSWSVVR